jgi:hypothetical protein
MSYRSYGIYQHGAIFKQEDFEPAKVILAVSEKIYEIALPENIKSTLHLNIFNKDMALEICEELEIEIKDTQELKDYSYISDALISEAHMPEWFEQSPSPLMGTKEMSVYVFSDMEGDYYYDNDEKSDEYVADGYMFSFEIPFIWDIRKRDSWHTREEIVEQLRESAKPLLKDDIDWDKRLGYLIGSEFG